jgi:cytochrome c553
MVGHDLDGPALAFIREEEVPEVIGLCLPWIHAAVPPAGTPTSVAIDSRGLLWVQTIEPAVLAAYDDVDRIGEVSLAASSVADTGHALLHAPSPVLLACVSCHPEGGDDGITWDVADQGLRRTQPLRGGLEGTAPFHWGGDLATMADLFHEVRHGRMRASDLSVDYADALQRYIFALPALAPPPTDPDAVEQGEVLFADAGCTTCHNGEQLTNNLTVPLPDYTPKQVPRLRGVALRPPYMHNGRAPDLASAVQEMTEMSSPSMEIGPTEIELLSEYLRSL